MNDAHLHLLTGAYAADALEPDERAEFEAHLAGCDACTQEVAELQETAALLGAAAAVPTSSALKARVMAQVATTRQEPRSSSAEVVDIGSRRRGLSPRWLGVAAALLAVAAVGLGAFGWRAAQQADGLTAELAVVADVLAAPDAVSAQASVGDGSGRVVVSESEGRGVFVGRGLDDPGSDETYQLWVIDADGAATSAGTFAPADDGTATLLMDVTPDDGDTVGLTVEPSGGSDAPTSDPLFAVQPT